jgi:hypothetical protein
MPRVSIATPERARPDAAPVGIAGAAGTQTYFDGAADPIHLHVHRLAGDAEIRMEAVTTDRLAYVWEGAVEAGGRRLETGSSFIVEHGAALDLAAPDGDAALVVFAAARPADPPRAGGHVHLLPRDQVPRVPDSRGTGTTGALHSDGTCPTCELWLNENSLAGRESAPTPTEAARGIHAHPEDEIIFITEGRIRLGTKLFDRGTALAIAAHTLYGFSPGPQGVSFITFRPSRADTIRFASGGDYGESTYFKGIERIPFLEPSA